MKRILVLTILVIIILFYFPMTQSIMILNRPHFSSDSLSFNHEKTIRQRFSSIVQKLNDEIERSGFLNKSILTYIFKNVNPAIINKAPNPPLIEGNKKIKANKEHSFTFSSTDPDGDQIHYLIDWGDGSYADFKDYSNRTIAPPPSGGMYIGQYEWMPGDIETFEAAIGKKVAWFSPYGVMEYDKQGYPVFNVVNAERSWKEAKIVLVHAIEADPDPKEGNAEGSFTIDKLCNGVYDEKLQRLADQFASFGKPMFFHTAREPLGIGIDYMGGFGPDGDKTTEWATRHQRAFDEFDPSGFPYSDLYHDLGDPLVSDGIERLVAAQRYYHHFFVEDCGLDFLMFDTMGWVCFSPEMIEKEIREYVNRTGHDEEYVRNLYQSSYDFSNFYPGDDYVDWVSINFYGVDWRIAGVRIPNPIENILDALDYTMSNIRTVASDKPVFFLEFGFADGMKKNSIFAAEKLTTTFERIINDYPEIHGFSMWSYHPFWGLIFPFDCLIRPGSARAVALRSIIDEHPDLFHSNVFFSDGSEIPSALEVSDRWIGPFASNESVTIDNYWFTEEKIIIRAKARDEHGAESDWSKIKISVPRSYSVPHNDGAFDK